MPEASGGESTIRSVHRVHWATDHLHPKQSRDRYQQPHPNSGCGHLDGGRSHFHSNLLAKRFGFYAVNVDYRLSGEARFQKALLDARCAIRWVRSRSDGLRTDSARVCVSGGPAGVHSEVEIYEVKSHAWFNTEPDRTRCYERMERFLVEQFGLQR